jgi:hypothetical protein
MVRLVGTFRRLASFASGIAGASLDPGSQPALLFLKFMAV